MHYFWNLVLVCSVMTTPISEKKKCQEIVGVRKRDEEKRTMGRTSRSHGYLRCRSLKLVNVGIQNTLPGIQGNPTPSAARSTAKLK